MSVVWSKVWPYDVIWPKSPSFALGDRSQIDGPRQIRTLLLQPSEPAERNAWVKAIVDGCVSEAGRWLIDTGSTSIVFEPARSFASATIHQEIWEAIRDADVVIVDLSDCNPNVMYELGVVAATRSLERVIVLRDRADQSRHPFDVSPIRYFLYDRSNPDACAKQITRNLIVGSFAADFERASDALHRFAWPSVDPVLDVDFRGAHDEPRWISPTNCGRRPTRHGLEFGHIQDITQSWLALAGVQPRDARIEAEFEFGRLLSVENPQPSWVSVGLRKEHPFANFGYMLHARANGEVAITIPTICPVARQPATRDYREPHLVNAPSRNAVTLCSMSGDCSRKAHTRDALAKLKKNAGSRFRLVLDLRGDRMSVEVERRRFAFTLAKTDRVLGPSWLMIQAYKCIARLIRVRVELHDV